MKSKIRLSEGVIPRLKQLSKSSSEVRIYCLVVENGNVSIERLLQQDAYYSHKRTSTHSKT